MPPPRRVAVFAMERERKEDRFNEHLDDALLRLKVGAL